MRGRPRSVPVVLALCVAVLASACGGNDPSEGVEARATTGGGAEGPTGGEFSMWWCEPRTLVPHDSNTTCGGTAIEMAIFAPLVDIDPLTGAPVMVAAESVTSDDQTTWTITLRDGWTFHDGEPVTAQSYVDAWNFAAYAPNGMANAADLDRIVGWDDLQGSEDTDPAAQTMSGLRVIDERTIEVELREPFSLFVEHLNSQVWYPLPSVAYDDLDTYVTAPIGNGPYVVEGEWVHDEGMRLARFDGWQGEPVHADAVNLDIYESVDTAWLEFLAGNLDVVQVPAGEIASARVEYADRLLESTTNGAEYLFFPTYDERFADPRIRRALSMAFDRQVISDTVFGGRYQAAESMGSSRLIEFRDGVCTACRHDPVEAKRLWDEAGGVDGPVTLWAPSGSERVDAATSIGNSFKAVFGVEFTIESVPFSEFVDKLVSQQMTGPFLIGWVPGDVPSLIGVVEPLLTSTGSNNVAVGWSDPRVDELVARAERAGSAGERTRLLREAEDILLADLPMAPLFDQKTILVWSERVAIDAQVTQQVDIGTVRVVG